MEEVTIRDTFECRYCQRSTRGRIREESNDLVRKITVLRPEKWHSIDGKLWCGTCDPRGSRVELGCIKALGRGPF